MGPQNLRGHVMSPPKRIPSSHQGPERVPFHLFRTDTNGYMMAPGGESNGLKK